MFRPSYKDMEIIWKIQILSLSPSCPASFRVALDLTSASCPGCDLASGAYAGPSPVPPYALSFSVWLSCSFLFSGFALRLSCSAQLLSSVLRLSPRACLSCVAKSTFSPGFAALTCSGLFLMRFS